MTTLAEQSSSPGRAPGTQLSPQDIFAQATVFVVDDDQAMCESLCWLIESIGLKAKSFTSAKDFLEAYNPATPGCLVTDVRMPDMTGLELHSRLTECGSPLPVLIITGHGDVPMAVRAMRKGAFDFLEKPFNDQTLLERIQQAILKDHQQREAILRELQYQTRIKSLTTREKQVLDLVVQAKLNKQMAGILELSEKTIETHRANLMRKMNATTVVELVRMVMEHRLGGAGDGMN